MKTRPLVTTATGVAAAALLLAACSSGSSSSSSSSSAGSSSAATSASASSSTPASSASSSAPAQAAGKPFGTGCAALGDPSVLAAAAALPVGQAAAAVPDFSSTVTAATAAGLVDTLNSTPDITVFVPTNEAFAAEPPAQVQALLTDPAQKPLLVATLQFHVVQGRLTAADLAGSHPTLNGQAVTVSGSGTDFTVGTDAKVLCGGIQTKNATVFVIDHVLHPAAG